MVRVRNTYSGSIGDLPPGAVGEVPEWVADGPLRVYLERVDPPDLTDAPGVRYERAQEPVEGAGDADVAQRPRRRKRGA